MVVLAALLNALKLTGKKIEEIEVVTSGAGAAGIAIIRLLMAMGLKKVILADRRGAIYEGREGLNPIKAVSYTHLIWFCFCSTAPVLSPGRNVPSTSW